MVTIVAVFLAIAVGLLAGSAFVQPGLVNTLRRQTDDLRDQTRELRQEVTDARGQITGLDGFADAALPYLVQDRLAGVPVVIVSQVGVEDAVVAEAQRALAAGGARVVATLEAQPKLASDDPDVQAELATLIGQPGALAVDMPELTAQALAARLATAPDSTAPDDDLLNQLLSAGYLSTGVSQATLQEIGTTTQAVIVLSGGQGDEPSPPPERFAVPLVSELGLLGVPVAAGESFANAFPFVTAVRAQGDDGTLPVDDLDLGPGGAALVLGLEELLATGRGGAYGVKDGAEPLPPLP